MLQIVAVAPMKTILLLFLLCTGVCACLFGNTYQGTTISVVTGTDNPAYTVGESLPGWYRYESPTVDGTFWTAGLEFPFNDSLELAIGFPTLPGSPENLLRDPPGKSPYLSLMIVDGGAITYFDASVETTYGPYYTFGFVRPGAFWCEAYDPSYHWDPPHYHTWGTVEFSQPRLVPDTAPTSRLLLIGVIGAVTLLHGVFRRREIAH